MSPHKPIKLHDISFVLSHKTCFLDYCTTIYHGQRIGVMGDNGCGKSTLLKMLAQLMPPSHGDIFMPEDVLLNYVPQMIEGSSTHSGAERFNHVLSQALAAQPNVLLLDEPTNHLDAKNRTSLGRMLKSFPHTLIIATHDVSLLRNTVDIIWHIDDGKISVFVSGYDDYMQKLRQSRLALEHEIKQLHKQSKMAHEALMKEQTRAKNSRRMGEKNIARRKWPTIVSSAKARRAEETSGHKKSQIREERQALSERLSNVRLPEVLHPKFHLATKNKANFGNLVTVNEASIGYSSIVLKDINFSLAVGERVAILGDNGSGKSTFMKALINHPTVKKYGTWKMPLVDDTGYLDQHYENLEPALTVLETIEKIRPDWQHNDVRQHLNDFLFRKNEQVHALVKTLSGGERARLSLCKIAARAPQLLLLDEITNNIDLNTREHVLQALNAYNGALVVISHDENFLQALGIKRFFRTNGEG